VRCCVASALGHLPIGRRGSGPLAAIALV